MSVSGPHDLGSFKLGSTVDRAIALNQNIGKLQKVILYNDGTDGWLLSYLECSMQNMLYQLSGRRQWLDSINVTLLNLYGNGYEPFSQESLEDLPARSTLELSN